MIMKEISHCQGFFIHALPHPDVYMVFFIELKLLLTTATPSYWKRVCHYSVLSKTEMFLITYKIQRDLLYLNGSNGIGYEVPFPWRCWVLSDIDPIIKTWIFLRDKKDTVFLKNIVCIKYISLDGMS